MNHCTLILQYTVVNSLVNMVSSIQKHRGPQKSMTRTQCSKIWNSCRLVHCVCVCVFSCVWLFEAQWIIAHQAPLSLGFPRQEYWSRLPFPPSGDLPDPGIQPCQQANSSLLSHQHTHLVDIQIFVEQKSVWRELWAWQIIVFKWGFWSCGGLTHQISVSKYSDFFYWLRVQKVICLFKK